MITFQARSQRSERAWASIYIHKIYRTCSNHHTREDWMIYRGPGFLAVVYDSAPRPPLPHLSSASCLSIDGRAYWLGVRGWAWSRIIRPQESLALYKSFNTLCITHSLSPSLPLSLPKSMHHPYRELRPRRWIVSDKEPQNIIIWLCVTVPANRSWGGVVGLVVYMSMWK